MWRFRENKQVSVSSLREKREAPCYSLINTNNGSDESMTYNKGKQHNQLDAPQSYFYFSHKLNKHNQINET